MLDFHAQTVYQIYIRSFFDSNGDGIGDLQGIIQKLDYLQKLGVDYLWITPFFKSPQRDNGYDIADYYAIDPVFGTMADVEELIRAADKRGIGIMLDMVFNHTSTEHEWFQRALAGDAKYQAYYIFKEGEPDGPPTDWQSKFGGSAWEYLPELKKWYLHLFDVSQADLNWDNPAVREEIKKIILFWKQKGIKGFRFDVINLVSKPEAYENDAEGDGRRFYTDGPHIHEYLQEIVADTGIENMVTVGEMSSTSLENCIRYSRPEEKELAMVFNFHHLKVDYMNGDKWALMPPDILELKKIFQTWQEGMQAADGWNALFWCNHDQPRALSRFTDDKAYRVQGAKMLAACMNLMRGTPYIYQGEEIGMTNAHYTRIEDYRDVETQNYYGILKSQGHSSSSAMAIINKRSRDNGRTPMQWDASQNAGFSQGDPWLQPAGNYLQINVAEATADKDSIFYFYQQLISLRKEYKLISDGWISFLCMDDARVIAYERYNGQGEKILVVANFTAASFDLPCLHEWEKGRLLLGNYQGQEISSQLKPYECRVIFMDSV